MSFAAVATRVGRLDVGAREQAAIGGVPRSDWRPASTGDFVRKVRHHLLVIPTAPAVSAVQIVWSSRRGSRSIEHIGSAHDDVELEALKAAAGQLELDLGLEDAGPAGPLPITSSRMGHLLDALDCGYRGPRPGGRGRRRRGVPAAGAGADHRASQQA